MNRLLNGLLSAAIAVSCSAAFAQWNGPAPGATPTNQDLFDGMYELSGVQLPPPPPGTAMPCKCCGARVDAKYITDQYPTTKEEDILLAYEVFWRTTVGYKHVHHGRDNDDYWWGGDHTMVCRYTPFGDWSTVPASAIPPITFTSVNFPVTSRPDARCYVGYQINNLPVTNDSYNTTCVVPAGAEVSLSSVNNQFPNIPPPPGSHGLTYTPGHHGDSGEYSGSYLGYEPAYRGLVKIHVSYTVYVSYSRWAMICTAGHDQSKPCDGAGGLGTVVPTPPPAPPAKNLAGDFTQFPTCEPPPDHDHHRPGDDE